MYYYRMWGESVIESSWSGLLNVYIREAIENAIEHEDGIWDAFCSVWFTIMRNRENRKVLEARFRRAATRLRATFFTPWYSVENSLSAGAEISAEFPIISVLAWDYVHHKTGFSRNRVLDHAEGLLVHAYVRIVDIGLLRSNHDSH
jgi:hypothetical protein